jgi:hypothetical protein
MSLTIKKSGGNFEPVPEGQFVARCYRVIDLGTQEVEWNGDIKHQQKVLVSWEILEDGVRMDNGEPYTINKTYTASLHEKSSLHKDLVAWRGKPFSEQELMGFEMQDLLGTYCTLQIVHNEKNGRKFANVNAIMGTKERPTPVNDDVWFDITKPDLKVLDSLGDYYKDKITSSLDYFEANAVDEVDEEPVEPAAEDEDVDPTKMFDN